MLQSEGTPGESNGAFRPASRPRHIRAPPRDCPILEAGFISQIQEPNRDMEVWWDAGSGEGTDAAI